MTLVARIDICVQHLSSTATPLCTSSAPAHSHGGHNNTNSASKPKRGWADVGVCVAVQQPGWYTVGRPLIRGLEWAQPRLGRDLV